MIERRKAIDDRRQWRTDPSYTGPERRVTCRRESAWSPLHGRWIWANEFIAMPEPWGPRYEISPGGELKRDGEVVEWEEDKDGYLRHNFRMAGNHKPMTRATALLAALTGVISTRRLHTAHGAYGRRCDLASNLRHSSASENEADKHRDGKTTAKMTLEQVADYRRRYRNGETIASLAREAGVVYSTMYQAISGAKYPTCPEPPVLTKVGNRKVDYDRVVELHKSGLTQQAIADEVGCSHTRVGDIVRQYG